MKLEFTRYGLKHDPRGAHVTLTYRNRVLLGEVMSVRRDETLNVLLLSVRYFNGEAWPIEPTAAAVDVLDRNAKAKAKEQEK